MKDATIVFDLDGTLVDTAPDLTNTLNHVLTARCLSGEAPGARTLPHRWNAARAASLPTAERESPNDQSVDVSVRLGL